ncbi:zinc finger, BED-type, Phospholipase-like, Homeodomain-like protein [Artemisia annua]|uniref:Zinc finger, BED-type, Phospholipase-like, Homeodomain-like protein n=1 Tax=Artemisia annua TaxID=35608 RepID=A0A2U1LQG6_ARTAN|nr:zinc finger, BED-type, Phospholipase-like, Homeodomain-like protein [Artemisia annua]
MSRRNQASQSQPTSSNNAASQAQGSTNQPFEVSIEKTTRNQEIWCHFDLVKFSDGSKKARCKACNTYISSSGNSTLKKHTNNHCKATKGVSGSDQNVMGRDGKSKGFMAPKNYPFDGWLLLFSVVRVRMQYARRSQRNPPSRSRSPYRVRIIMSGLPRDTPVRGLTQNVIAHDVPVQNLMQYRSPLCE